MTPMDPVDLLHDWLATSALRPSSRAQYQREVMSFLTWCLEQTPPVDAITAGPAQVAAWSRDRFLHVYLDGKALRPDTLALIAQNHPEAARTHDRRITALTQYFDAAVARGIITIPPDLKALRSGVPRPAGARNRLNPRELALLLAQTGAWGPTRSTHWQRDQLVIYLLLEGLRPGKLVRIDTRHLYPLPDGGFDVRVPDSHESLGPKFTLDPMTGAALTYYRRVRPEPADPECYALLLNDQRRPLDDQFPLQLVERITATHPMLSDRKPAITADAIAHTGLWDTPDTGG